MIFWELLEDFSAATESGYCSQTLSHHITKKLELENFLVIESGYNMLKYVSESNFSIKKTTPQYD